MLTVVRVLVCPKRGGRLAADRPDGTNNGSASAAKKPSAGGLSEMRSGARSLAVKQHEAISSGGKGSPVIANESSSNASCKMHHGERDSASTEIPSQRPCSASFDGCGSVTLSPDCCVLTRDIKPRFDGWLQLSLGTYLSWVRAQHLVGRLRFGLGVLFSLVKNNLFLFIPHYVPRFPALHLHFWNLPLQLM